MASPALSDSRRRTLLIVVAGFAPLPYLGIWLYTVTLLSYLSLSLVIVVGGTARGLAFLARKALLKAGVAESRLVGVARALGWILAALAGLGVVALVVLFVRMACYSSSIFFEEPQVHAPLGKASITRVKGVTNEVFATLASA